MKAKRYFFSKNFLVAILENGLFPTRVVKGMPTDSKVIEIQYDIDLIGFTAIVKHDSFPDIPEGEEIPMAEDPIISFEPENKVTFREFI